MFGVAMSTVAETDVPLVTVSVDANKALFDWCKEHRTCKYRQSCRQIYVAQDVCKEI